jgi:hypothetical protein
MTQELREWLRAAGLTDVSIDREDGLPMFSAPRPGMTRFHDHGG